MNCFIQKIMKRPALLLLVMTAMLFRTSQLEGDRLQQDIAAKVLRFHVRANSDSGEDQELKLKVRNSIMEYLEPYLISLEGIDETRKVLAERMEEVSEVARQTIVEQGYEYDVRVYFTREYFPVRKYGEVVLPPGEYEALRVDIGEAQGKNWWCILYPSMCFVETTHAVYPGEELRENFTQEEYEYITEYEVQFKYLTFLNKYM